METPSPTQQEEKKKGIKSFGYTSEFNMSQLTMNRIDIMHKEADRYSVIISNLAFKYLPSYYNTLKAIYRYVRTLMNANDKLKYDERFNSMRDLIYKEAKLGWRTFKTLEELHNDLIEQMFNRNLLWSTVRDAKYAENYFKEEYKT